MARHMACMLLQHTLHAIERCRLLRIKGGAFAILQEKHMPGSSAGRCGHHANDLSMQPRMVCATVSEEISMLTGKHSNSSHAL